MSSLITSASDGVDFFGLDDVYCADGATSIDDCTSTTTENCLSGEEVYIQCLTVYTVGAIGPAGGIVFYVTEGGIHGLEASPVDLADSPWGCFGTNISGSDGIAIGTGAQNTADIVAGCVSAEVTAAELTNDYSFNGFTDWFLPSKNELIELYLHRAVMGASNVQYWSSTEIDSSTAWRYIFINNTQAGGGRGGSIGVRPVRAF